MQGASVVAVAPRQSPFASTPDVRGGRDAVLASAPVWSGRDGAVVASSPGVWNSRTSPLSDALRGRATPTVVRDSRGGGASTTARRDPDQFTSTDHRHLYVHSITTASVVVAEVTRSRP